MSESKQTGFYITSEKECHKKRRVEILEKYPQVRELTTLDKTIILKTIIMVAIQLTLAFYIDKFNPVLFVVFAYFIGATITQSLFLAVHEITHNMCFRKQWMNNLFAMVANFPIVFPFAISFKIYHNYHHRQMGEFPYDSDIPTELETKIFRGWFGKFVWYINQIFFYTFRPMFTFPLKLQKWQVINILVQLSAMAVFLPFAGWNALFYLLLSAFFAGGLNPLAGHFIAEHYVTKEGQETYSYYGPLNIFIFNAGYHNEHHDFPSIPGSRLPKLKKLAPEYYDNIASYNSYLKVIYNFIFNGNLSLHSRVKRISNN